MEKKKSLIYRTFLLLLLKYAIIWSNMEASMGKNKEYFIAFIINGDAELIRLNKTDFSKLSDIDRFTTCFSDKSKFCQYLNDRSKHDINVNTDIFIFTIDDKIKFYNICYSDDKLGKLSFIKSLDKSERDVSYYRELSKNIYDRFVSCLRDYDFKTLFTMGQFNFSKNFLNNFDGDRAVYGQEAFLSDYKFYMNDYLSLRNMVEAMQRYGKYKENIYRFYGEKTKNIIDDNQALYNSRSKYENILREKTGHIFSKISLFDDNHSDLKPHLDKYEKKFQVINYFSNLPKEYFKFDGGKTSINLDMLDNLSENETKNIKRFSKKLAYLFWRNIRFNEDSLKGFTSVEMNDAIIENENEISRILSKDSTLDISYKCMKIHKEKRIKNKNR